jgi:hypothetical protein
VASKKRKEAVRRKAVPGIKEHRMPLWEPFCSRSPILLHIPSHPHQHHQQQHINTSINTSRLHHSMARVTLQGEVEEFLVAPPHLPEISVSCMLFVVVVVDAVPSPNAAIRS